MSDNSGLLILVIEDHVDIAQNLADYFEARGHTLDFAINGLQGLDMALTQYFDVIILDITLPGLNGWEVCREIRKRADRHIPIVMLTARDKLEDKLEGLTIGADDYLTKPFSMRELELRLVLQSRRQKVSSSGQIEIGDLVIDKGRHMVFRAGKEISLNQVPFKILAFLADNYPRVVSRRELYQHIWGDEYNDSDSLRSHIYQLRRAIDKPFSCAMIKTIHNVGFTLQESSQ